MSLALGLDFATQSARAVILDENGQIYNRISIDLAPVITGSDGSRRQDPQSWLDALDYLVSASLKYAEVNKLRVSSLAITATSGTFVLCDESGSAVSQGVMYNDGTAKTPLERAALQNLPGNYFKHVPEFLISHLTGEKNIAADWSHSLKSGFDLKNKQWEVKSELNLPDVVAPGTKLGEYQEISIFAGMTDGCTGQISAGGATIGSAVTTLGTTLVTKIVSEINISGPGFYSHLLPQSKWLAGGASNLGGISLKKFNDLAKMNIEAEKLGASKRIIYPLTGKGERFPIADTNFLEVADSQPISDLDEFLSIIQGIAFAEKLSYQKLEEAGGPKISSISTVGGGTKSDLWSSLRATIIGKPIMVRKEAGSDIGAAMIALAALSGSDLSIGLSKIKLQPGIKFEPNPKIKAELDEGYAKFLKLIHHSHIDH